MSRHSIVTRENVNQIEGFLPVLFRVGGLGEDEARNAAMELMAVLDAIDIDAPLSREANAAVDRAISAIESLETSLDSAIMQEQPLFLTEAQHRCAGSMERIYPLSILCQRRAGSEIG